MKRAEKPIDWEKIEADVQIQADSLRPIIRVRTKKLDEWRDVLIGLTEEEKRYLNYEYKPKGKWKLSLELGLRRGLKVAGNVGVLFAAGAGGALVKGVTSPLGLVGAGVAAAAVGIGPVMAAEKVLKVAPGKDRHGLSAVFVLLGKLLIEVVRYLKSRKVK